MNINATLFWQLVTFAVFIGITWKYIWPPVIKALDDRQKKIADGIAAAEKSVQSLAETQIQVAQQLQTAKTQAAEIVEEANKRGNRMMEEARDKARLEGERLINVAKTEIAQQAETAKQALRRDVANLTMQAAEKLLTIKVDQHANDMLIEKLIAEIN